MIRKCLGQQVIDAAMRKCFLLFVLVALAVGLTSTATAKHRTTSTISVSVSISPTSASLLTGATKQFSATVGGTTNTAVNWSVNGVAGGNTTVGTVSTAGLYTAPASVPSGSVTVTAQSQADTTKSAGAAVTITAPVIVSISVSPTSASVNTGATQQFAASVGGTSNSAVNWSVNGVAGGNTTVGTVSASGLYTAPASVPSGSVTVTAQSQADTTKSAGAAVTITAPVIVSISVSPTSASVNTGATQQFAASVGGTSNTAVNWSVNGVAGGNTTVGTVSTAGLYTAPASVPSGSVTVTAQSQADTTKSASAAITVSAPPQPPTSTYALSVSTQSSHAGAIALNGATISGSEYVFTSMASALTNYNPTGIASVCFWLDNTAMNGTATHCESVTPYDYAGSVNNTATSAGNPWNTTTLTNGTHTITQQATLSAGGTEVDTATFTINNVAPPPPALSITTASVSGATVNVAYSTTLGATGGTSPYTWSMPAGSLPSGVSMSSTGVISGTPTATGSFAFTAQVSDSAGHTASTNETLTVGTTPTTGAKFFAPSSFINTVLPASPSVDPNSASMVANSLAAQASAAHLSNDSYGVGLVYASASDKVYSVACTTYDSNTCLVGSSINFPIPAGATPPTGTDHNTAFIYTAQDGSAYAGMELDCWIAQYNSSNDTWSCGTASLVHNNSTTAWGTCAEGNIVSFHCNGGYAAGFDFAAGPIRPEEIAAGAINHALVVAYSNPGSGITCPATHTDHSGTGVPEGGHFFLPASYNVDGQSWPTWVKLVAHALQNYGGYIVDYGGSMEVKGFTDKNPGSITWASVGVPDDQGGDLSQIPWSQMQVVAMQSCN